MERNKSKITAASQPELLMMKHNGYSVFSIPYILFLHFVVSGIYLCLRPLLFQVMEKAILDKTAGLLKRTP